MRVLPLLVALIGCTGDIPTAGPDPGPQMEQPDGGSVRPPDAAPPASALSLLKQWSGCMTLANFKTAKMASAWGAMVTTNAKQCQNCHQDGAYGFIATSNEQLFFDTITQHSSFMAMYFSADIPNNKVIINTSSFKGANSTVGHPNFDPVTNPGMTALTTFYTATAAITTCDPPKMID